MTPVDRTKIAAKYKNQWIALNEEDKVVGNGKTLEIALKKATRRGCLDPVFSKVPDPKYSYLF